MEVFSVGGTLQLIGSAQGVHLWVTGVDDDCFGVVINSDYPIVQFLQQHAGLYNFQIIDQSSQGGVIYCPRVAVNADLSIDLSVNESECILKQGSPVIKYTRVDPLSLPFQVDVQYIDPDRNYAVNTQSAKHIGATVQNAKLTVPIAFVIGSDQARSLAYDYLYRIWGQTLTIEIEHPNLQPEPGDVILLSTDISNSGTYICLVLESTITKNRTNQLRMKALLTTTGITVALGGAAAAGTGGIGSGTADGFGQSTASSSFVSATFSGAGSLSTTTATAPPSWTTFVGLGSLFASAVGSASKQTSAKLSGSGSLKASTVQATLGATLPGSGSLRASTLGRPRTASGSFAGAGSLSADGLGARLQAPLNGVGSLSASTVSQSLASASLSGAGSLSGMATSGGGGVSQSTATLPGSGSLKTDTTQTMAGRYRFAGAGSLSADTTQNDIASAEFDGAGSLNAVVTSPFTASAEFDGVGSLSTDTTQHSSLQTGSAEFDGIGSLTAASTVPVKGASGSFSGAGNLLVNSIAPGTPKITTVAAISGAVTVNSAIVALPASLVVGNILLAFVQVVGGGKTFSVGGGWNIIDTSTNGYAAWAWRIIDGTQAAPTFTWSGLATVHGLSWQISGVDAGAPIGAFSSNSGTSTNLNVGHITTTRDLSLVVGILLQNLNAIPGQPLGFSSLAGNSNFSDSNGGNRVCYESTTPAGALSDDISLTQSNVMWAAFQIEILQGPSRIAKMSGASTMSNHATRGGNLLATMAGSGVMTTNAGVNGP